MWLSSRRGFPEDSINQKGTLYRVIERFHSRGQQLCKFIRTNESVYIRKEFNSHGIGLGHQHGRRFIVLEHQYGRRDVTCENALYTVLCP